LVLAFYPQFGLKRSEPSVRATIASAQAQAAAGSAAKVATGRRASPVRVASR
jgi:hypothetical protein